MHKIRKICGILAIVLLQIALLPLQTFAATNSLSGLTFSESIVSGTTATISISKSRGSSSKATKTVTITNNNTYKVQVDFDYSGAVSGDRDIGSYTINAPTNGSKDLEENGKCKITLLAGGSFSVYTEVDDELGFVGSAGYTFTMSNIVVTPIYDSSDLTVNYDSTLGSVTYGSTTVSAGSTLFDIAVNEVLTAAANSGTTFLGWIDATGRILSRTTTYAVAPTADAMTVEAVFTTTSPWFYVDSSNYLVEGLAEAVKHAGSIILANDAILAAGNYTIPSEVTLVIPYDEQNTVVTTSPAVVTSYSTSAAPSAFRTLTMENGAKLTLDGSLSIGGTLVASQTYGYNGLPTGKLGYIKMEQGSSIEANNGSCMYVIGYIHGDGTVNVNSGATVYECFQIRDFRGGSATSTIKSAKKVFPLSQYYVQNIEVPMTLNSGAIVNGLTAFNINSGFQIPVIPFIGNTSTYMFQIANGSIVKDYAETTDRLDVQINGTLTISPFSFEIPGFAGMASIDTSNFVLPINQNITVEVASGKSLTISQDISLLPGAEILVNEGATCTITSGKKVIVYDSAQWGNYCGEKHYSTDDDVAVKPLLFVAGGAPKIDRFTTDATSLADGSLMINGTVDASAGQLQVTAGGANIYSTGSGTLKLGTPPAEETDYQAIQDGSSISYANITIYPAKLLNSDGTYRTTAADTYTYSNGVWNCTNHTYGNPVFVWSGDNTRATASVTCTVCAGVKDLDVTMSNVPTPGNCQTNSVTTYTASVTWNGEPVSEEQKVTGELGDHSLQKTEAVTANCTQAGNNEYYTCTIETCGKVFEADKTTETTVEAETIAQLDHADTDNDHICNNGCNGKISDCSGGTATCTAQAICGTCGKPYGNLGTHAMTHHEAVAPDCTKDGTVEYWSCSDCNKNFSNENGTDVLESTVDAAKGHDKMSHAAQAPTCTEIGWDAYETCNRCDYTTYVEKAATGHDYDEGVVTTDPTCTEAGVKTFTCKNDASHTYTEPVAATGHSYSTEWSKDETNHWHECACGDKSDVSEHSWNEGEVTTEATTTQVGERTYTCTVCGQTKTEEIPVVEVTVIYGDVNGDGVVTATDASLILQYAVGKITAIDIKTADVSGDGVVTATDASLILQFAVGKITEFPVAKN